MDVSDIRAYRSRPAWAQASALKAQWWTQVEPKDKIRIADGLRQQALALQPDWPGEEARQEDLDHHEEVAAILARTARR